MNQTDEQQLIVRFETALKKAVDKFGVKWIADLFGMTRPTVERWTQGLDYPHPVMMALMVRELEGDR